MSFQAMTWAVEQDLPAIQKLVLLMLANCCNHHTGQCNPSHEKLAKECGMSRDSVKRAVSELAEKGLLEIVRNVKDGVNLPNQYNLMVGSSMGVVGADSTEGGCSQHRGVGADSTTNQEVKPGIKPKACRASHDTLLMDWIKDCKAKGETPISADDPIFGYAAKQGLSDDFVRYAWLEFRRKYSESGKKQKDWRATFRNAVRENWYGLWFKRDNDFMLTTRGQQVKAEHDER